MKRGSESKKQRVFFSRNANKQNFFRSPTDGKSNALLHHCTFKDWSLRDRVVNLCPFSVGGPLYFGDIEEIGQAALPCVVYLWRGWKYYLQTGLLKETHKRNITLGTYPVRVHYKGELLVGFESLSPDYFNCSIVFWKNDEVALKLGTLWRIQIVVTILFQLFTWFLKKNDRSSVKLGPCGVQCCDKRCSCMFFMDSNHCQQTVSIVYMVSKRRISEVALKLGTLWCTVLW